jgi:regulator of protease activity HflC (stomatin/prohibitin superfamily)
MFANLILLAIVATIILILLLSAIRIVPEYQRLAVFRVGRCIGAKGPGLVLLIPIIDRGVRVDLREIYLDVPPQTCITQDNASVSIDFLIYMKIVDSLSSVLNVADYEGAARGIAITTLRAVVGDMLLDEVLSRRESINQVLRGKLDEVTNRWGIKVNAVEIREIVPPRDILEAMGRQMSAERTRRAMILEADGQRDAAIRVAEGERQAQILRAKGDRRSTILRAEGYALALQQIFSIASTVDSKTMSLQYLDALKTIGSNPSTKFVIPVEWTALLRPFIGHAGDSLHSREEAPSEESRPSAH